MVPDIWSMTDNFLSFWTVFYPFTPLWTKNQNFEKMKKTPEDIIILQVCTINDSHMMYGSWDMECNEQNFLSFWTVFFPFTPLTTQNIKILQKWQKNTWRYYHFTQVYHKWQSYDVWFLRYPRQTKCFVILEHFLPSPSPLFLPSHPKNQNFEKTKKNHGDIILHMCTINDNHCFIWFLGYGVWRTEFFVIVEWK